MFPYNPAKPDRTGWPPGSWDAEPDNEDWLDPATGLHCAIMRMENGAVNGYVAVPKGHPLFGKSYSDEVPTPPGWSEREVNVDEDIGIMNLVLGTRNEGKISLTLVLFCHGGLTYSQETDGLWWFGFDTSHAGDFSPGRWYGLGGVYRSFSYVKSQVTRLAQQIHTYKETPADA